jgi:hypothetical protein
MQANVSISAEKLPRNLNIRLEQSAAPVDELALLFGGFGALA